MRKSKLPKGPSILRQLRMLRLLLLGRQNPLSTKSRIILKASRWSCLPYKRLKFLYEAAEKAPRGCFVECGVWRGGSAGLLASFGRATWLFDSWKGLPKAGNVDIDIFNTTRKAGAVKANVKEAKHNTQSFLGNKNSINNLHFIRGWFKETIKHNNTKIGKIALLHLDCDYYKSVKTCLEQLYNKVVSGGYVIIDDYGLWQGCKKATDEFVKDKNIKLIKIDNNAVYFRKRVK